MLRKISQELIKRYEPELGIPLVFVREGKAVIIVPKLEAFADKYGHVDPTRAPVFYNPRMVINRDLAIIAARVFQKYHWGKELRICEPFCSTGIRGIRYSLEVNNVECVVMGDINSKAVRLAEINVKLNKVDTSVYVKHADAIELLSSYLRRGKKFSLIDIDPFGSPSVYVLSAARALVNGGLLTITATDLPPLMGKFPLACRRKYLSMPIKVSYGYEVGLRILIGYIARELGKLEMGMKVLLSYYMDHYMRVYVVVRRGAKVADDTINLLGYLQHCSKCGWRKARKGFVPSLSNECPKCGNKLLNAGPLWLGPLGDKNFLRETLKEVMEEGYMESRKKLYKLLSILCEEIELQIPYYYTVSELARLTGTLEVSPRKMVKALRDEGYEACITHFDPKGIKTDASLEVLMVISKKLA